MGERRSSAAGNPMRPFCIYIATCLVNGKVYVGQTCMSFSKRRSAHEVRKDCHGPFQRAIRKYGRSSFHWQVIATVPSKDAADNLERTWIALLASTDRKYGYNITEGGSGSVGVRKSDAARAKVSIALRKAWAEGRMPRHCLPVHATPHSEETRARLSTIGKNRPRMVPKVCTVQGCGRPMHANSFCSSHWHRMKRYGNPLAGNPIGVKGPLPGTFSHSPEAIAKIAYARNHRLQVIQ